MAQSDHSRTSKPRRVPRVPREGSTRTSTRIALARGQWDDQPSTMPTRVNRRATIG